MDGKILAVDVHDCVTQFADGSHWVDSIPEQVAGVKVAAQGRTGSLPHTQEGLYIIEQHARVNLYADFDVVLLSVAGSGAPVGDSHLVPLVIENLEEVGRPGAGEPIGDGVGGRASRQPRHGIDYRYTQHLSQLNGFAQQIIRLTGNNLIRANRVPVRTEGRDDHTAALDSLEVSLPFVSAG